MHLRFSCEIYIDFWLRQNKTKSTVSLKTITLYFKAKCGNQHNNYELLHNRTEATSNTSISRTYQFCLHVDIANYCARKKCLFLLQEVFPHSWICLNRSGTEKLLINKEKVFVYFTLITWSVNKQLFFP